MQNNSETMPIFILGSGRSGTTIISSALRFAANIDGYGEGHFLPLMGYLIKEVRRFYGSKQHLIHNQKTMISQIEKSEIENEIINIFASKCNSLHPQKVWIDKSPDSPMINSIPLLLKAWPKSRYIFAKRRGIENISSRLNKFPDKSFETHCIVWKKTMESWLDIKNKLKPDCYLEIEQREISLNPKIISVEIGKFLNFSPETTSLIENFFIDRRPQSTRTKEQKKAIDINESDWTEEQIQIFRKYCGEINRKFGYSETSSYYL